MQHPKQRDPKKEGHETKIPGWEHYIGAVKRLRCYNQRKPDGSYGLTYTSLIKLHFQHSPSCGQQRRKGEFVHVLSMFFDLHKYVNK